MTPRYAVVTTFSPEGFELYGRRFLETFAKFWLAETLMSLVVYVEGEGASSQKDRRRHPNCLFLDLDRDPDRRAFLANPIPDKRDYRWQAKRFCHKVFAMTHAPSACDWWIWLDADTITHKPVTSQWLSEVCPPNVLCSYLGRSEWHHSECGWLAFNLNEGARDFLRDFRSEYTSGRVYGYDEWHDSYVFDRVRERYEAKGARFANLSPAARGLDAWPASPLAQCMTHLKGNLKHG